MSSTTSHLSSSPSLLQTALGDDWHKLPPALQRHYAAADTVDTGDLAVSFPGWMQPILLVLHVIGALLYRRAEAIHTTVEKCWHPPTQQQIWQRTLRYPTGKTLRFNSRWQVTPTGAIQEFVNPLLALQMRPMVQNVAGQGTELHYRGECFILQLGNAQFHLPEGLLGHTRIIEKAITPDTFHMDFQLIHPWFGQVFRYTGEFKTDLV